MAADLILKSFDYKGELPTTLKEGEVYSVRIAEDNDVIRDVPLFIRKHLVEKEHYFQKFLAGKKFSRSKMKIVRRKLFVTGPPGCGKTVFTTLLAHRYAAGAITNNAPKRVLMILFREFSFCHIFIIEGHETKMLQEKVSEVNIRVIVEQLLKDKNIEAFDLCILDGVRQTMKVCSHLMQLLNLYTGEAERIKKTIFTTSLQFIMKSGDIPMGNSRGHEEMNFDSFTEDDYLHATTNKMFLKRLLANQPDIMDDILHCKNEGKPRLEERGVEEEEEESSEGGDHDAELDAFLADDSNIDATREYVNFKYYYAGGSARYMFEYTTLTLKSGLEKLFGKVQQDEWEVFASSTLSPRASSSVNSLMQQFKGFTSAVSKHVLFEAYDKVEGRLVGAVQAAAEKSKNPALKGWAFELQQLHIMKTVLQNNSLDNRREKVLKTKEGLCFQPVKDGEASFDGNQLTKSGRVELDTGIIIWCMKWNQGCFDVAFFKGNTLLTLQFTVSGVHSLKLQFIKALKDAIESNLGSEVEVRTCIHVGVVGGSDSTTFDGFSFGDPQGAGRTGSNWRHDFTVKTYKASELMAMEGSDQQERLEATHLGDMQVHTKKRDLDQVELQAANASSKVAKA